MATYLIENERGFYLQDFDDSSSSWTVFDDCARQYNSKEEAQAARRKLKRRTGSPYHIKQIL